MDNIWLSSRLVGISGVNTETRDGYLNKDKTCDVHPKNSENPYNGQALSRAFETSMVLVGFVPGCGFPIFDARTIQFVTEN